MFFFTNIRYLLTKTKFMKRIIHLNESQLKSIIERVINESKKVEDSIQKKVDTKKPKKSQKEMVEDIDPSELEVGKSYEYPHPDSLQREPMEYEASFDDLGSLRPNSKIYKFKKGKGAAIFTDVTPIQKYQD